MPETVWRRNDVEGAVTGRRRPGRIDWRELEICPTLHTKDGTRRRASPLTRDDDPERSRRDLRFLDERVELTGHWSNEPRFGSLLSLKLRNRSDRSITITRLVFPTENGIEPFLSIESREHLSFLRNGHQSWSTARSYRLGDRPLRPWLRLVSLASSNLADLPSGERGMLSSEMYAVIANLDTGEAFLIGQTMPFGQFLYVRLQWTARSQRDHFHLVFDFGRKLLGPGQEVELDGVVMAHGRSIALQQHYFDYVAKKAEPPVPQRNLTGWNSWYCFHNHLQPDDILRNVDAIRAEQLDLDYIQIDDGYQSRVGDWLSLRPEFAGRMRELADAIRKAGFRPGIWLAPYIAERRSELLREYPDYLLRSEQGRPILAGYNLFWRGRYYGLDVTDRRLAEYVQRVVRTMVQEWGFELLKCDFLFGACIRGGSHQDMTHSRAEIMQMGMELIRHAAGRDTVVLGCGMPLSAGIGTVEAMRIGTDTGPYWTMAAGRALRTGAMVGVRNSIRNTMVRSPMHRRLWLNDPDCLMVRTRDTKLNEAERISQINAIVLSGGALTISDDISQLPPDRLVELKRVIALSGECARGHVQPLDLMEHEVPSCVYNTAGFLGVFNVSGRRASPVVDLSALGEDGGAGIPKTLTDVWKDERLFVRPDGRLLVPDLPAHGSRLLRADS